MKKVLFMSLAMAIAMTGFAQKANFSVGKNVTATQKRVTEKVSDGSAIQGLQFNMPHNMVSTSRSLEDFTEYETMTTNYDLQSNSTLGNRIAVWPDGSAAFTATWDYSGSTSFPDRGTGYNFYNPEEENINDKPEVRQEPMKSGWPSIAACGDGEVLASHASGTNVYYRPTKGEGEWQLLANFPEGTWPRIICSGPDDEYIHLVFADQIGNAAPYDNHVYYVRSTDRGQTWSEVIDFPGIDNSDEGDYRNTFAADDYVMAANGNDVAVMFGSWSTEVFYMISHDNGETWEKQLVAPYCVADAEGNVLHAISFDDYPDGMVDTLFTCDNSFSIAIGNDGTVHCAFGLFTWRVSDADHYSYWRAYNHGIVYWNSNFTNEQGGHEIPLFGDWSGDADLLAEDPTWALNGLNGIANTLHLARLNYMINVMGSENLNWFGYCVDENYDGDWTDTYISNPDPNWSYRTLGLSTLPGVSVDEEGNVAIIYNTLSEVRHGDVTGVDYAYRNAWVTLRDNCGTWFADTINLSEDFVHAYDEAYYTTASPRAYNGEFWVMYNADMAQGTYLDKSDDYPNSNGGDLSENFMYACKIVPVSFENWDVKEKEAVNPMTSTRVYPNPATDVLNIEVNASQPSEMSISVYNIMGQKVMDKNVNINTGINCPSISTSDLTTGIYFVTVKANGFENTMKFIVK